MSGMPLVSVIIPTYCRPTYLERCIESVINQTYSNIEIFVVDDNNPDTDERNETSKIMRKYSDYKSIHYLQHKKNKNGSAARNTGWRNASGEYITYIDDDDIIEPTKIQKQVECLEALDDSWGACYTGYKIIKKQGDEQISTEHRSGCLYVEALMRTMFMGSGSNLLLRKSVVDSIGGYDETFRRNQDIEFLVRVLENNKLAYVNETLLIIHQDGNRERRSFKELDEYAKHYLAVFYDRIQNLSKKDKKRVISVISLERCRVAFFKKEYFAGIKILIENKVSLFFIMRYCIYLIKRLFTHKSYGFSG